MAIQKVPLPIISCEESLMSAILVCNNKLLKSAQT
jgi:hypothetical protein